MAGNKSHIHSLEPPDKGSQMDIDVKDPGKLLPFSVDYTSA